MRTKTSLFPGRGLRALKARPLVVMKQARLTPGRSLHAIGTGDSECQSDRLSRVMKLDGRGLFFNPKRVGEIKVSNED